MWRTIALFLASIVMAPNEKLQGRWDLTLETPSGPAPSWLEIEHSGRDALVGRFVGIDGSARPISLIVADGDSLHFEIPRQWEAGSGSLIVDGRFDGERLTGRMVFPDGKTTRWTGTRAPLLHPDAPPHWNAPIRLLHEKDLGGWHAVGGNVNQWIVEDGVLRSPQSGANIATDETFGDFKLHIEFRFPAGSNSGVYLRGRYEVQITDDFGLEPNRHRFAAIYGFLEPNEMAARRAGEWQTYDVTLVGRRVTVVANGRTVICDRDIPGITGGALDSKEGAPGPILLQGDHGPIEFRNITITPAR
jgi:Domain of Unknown Function (DUF1080)